MEPARRFQAVVDSRQGDIPFTKDSAQMPAERFLPSPEPSGIGRRDRVDVTEHSRRQKGIHLIFDSGLAEHVCRKPGNGEGLIEIREGLLIGQTRIVNGGERRGTPEEFSGTLHVERKQAAMAVMAMDHIGRIAFFLHGRRHGGLECGVHGQGVQMPFPDKRGIRGVLRRVDIHVVFPGKPRGRHQPEIQAQMRGSVDV